VSGKTNYERYRAARDQLMLLRGRHDAAVQHFSWPALESPFNWAHDWFDRIAAIHHSTTALHIVEEDGASNRYSYGQLAHRSNQVAHWLAQHGVARGDSVMIMLGNQLELWETMLGAMKLGAVLMPTTPALSAGDLPDRLARGNATHVIANAADTHKFDGLAPEITRVAVGEARAGWLDYQDSFQADTTPLPHPGTDVDERLFLYFTSGTTSRPKMVEHSHQSYPVGHLTTGYWLGLAPGDIHLNISSPGWAKHAWSCLFAPWIAEATIFVYNYTRFDPRALLAQIREHAVTTFCAPPTVWRMLIKSDLAAGPALLRDISAAGEPLNPEVIEQVRRAWGLTLRDGFGQTETTALIANTPGTPVKPGSMGRPLPGVPVVLVDPVSGQPADAEGEICLDLSANPRNLMTAYRGDEERTAEAMSGGYFHTGDVATRDSEGHIFYTGRTDDVFKASDYKVSPFEVESVLLQHPAVLEAAVVPTPDAVRLAIPKAYVTVSPGCEPDKQTARSILKFARENLPPFLRVRRLEFYDLPKTSSGKIRRAVLRAREQDDRSTAEQCEWRDDQFPDISS
jgi:acetyl-CoA synthetase